jgi:hypothetical protein
MYVIIVILHAILLLRAHTDAAFTALENMMSY